MSNVLKGFLTVVGMSVWFIGCLFASSILSKGFELNLFLVCWVIVIMAFQVAVRELTEFVIRINRILNSSDRVNTNISKEN